MGLIPGSGRSGEGNGNPLQYSCWETPAQRRLAGYSPWCHKSVRHDSVTKQQHSAYILFSIVFSFFKKCEVLNILKYISLKCGVQ